MYEGWLVGARASPGSMSEMQHRASQPASQQRHPSSLIPSQNPSPLNKLLTLSVFILILTQLQIYKKGSCDGGLCMLWCAWFLCVSVCVPVSEGVGSLEGGQGKRGWLGGWLAD